MVRLIHIFFSVILLLSLTVPSSSVAAAGNDVLEIPLEAINGNKTIRLEGLFETQSLEFIIPRNWKVNKQSWLDLSVTASGLLAIADSSITISLNGLQIISVPLDKLLGNGLRIPLPPDFLTAGNNLLAFDGVLYLPDDLKTNCKGWEDPSRWLYFNPQSSLHLGFEKLQLPADLSNFPDSFLQPLDRYMRNGSDQTLFVLPDTAQPDDLDALATTAYFLGHQAGVNFPWSPKVITESSFVALGKVDQNVVFVNNIPAPFENAIIQEKNAIGVFSSPWRSDRTILIIHDQDRSDGYTPAIIFGDWLRKVLLRGNIAYIDATAKKNPPAFKNKYTFEELGYLDRTVRGIGVGTLIYKIYIPYYANPTSANLSLQISHSPELDNRTSSISVNLNGFTVASILPATQNSHLEPIRVDLPTKRFRPGVNYISISFDLHIPYSTCEKSLETVWATLFNSSAFQLTYRERTSIPTLKDFPSPFNEAPSPTIVVPDNPDPLTLEAITQLNFLLGASAFLPSQPSRIMTATEYSTSDSRTGNFILVGLPSKNHSIRDVNDFLPQPFMNNSDQPQNGYGVYLPTPNTRASVGLLQITPSPWDREGIILVLTGTDSQAVARVWSSVLNPEIRSHFSGNLMVVGATEQAASVVNTQLPADTRFEQTTVVMRIPLIGRYLQQNGQNAVFLSLAAITLAGLFTFIALKLAPFLMRLEIRLRSHSNEEGKERE